MRRVHSPTWWAREVEYILHIRQPGKSFNYSWSCLLRYCRMQRRSLLWDLGEEHELLPKLDSKIAEFDAQHDQRDQL